MPNKLRLFCRIVFSYVNRNERRKKIKKTNNDNANRKTNFTAMTNTPKRKIEQVNGAKETTPKKTKLVEAEHVIELKMSTDERTAFIFGTETKDKPFQVPIDLPRFKVVDTVEELIEQVRGKYVIDQDGIWEDFREEARKGGSCLGAEYEKEEGYEKWHLLITKYGLKCEEVDNDFGLMILDCLISMKCGCLDLFLNYLTRAIRKHYPKDSQDYLLPFIQFARFEHASKDSNFPYKLSATSFLIEELERRNNGFVYCDYPTREVITQEARSFLLDLNRETASK